LRDYAQSSFGTERLDRGSIVRALQRRLEAFVRSASPAIHGRFASKSLIASPAKAG
jgi:hypothetical protein